jgi:hypothetical protein
VDNTKRQRPDGADSLRASGFGAALDRGGEFVD